MLAASALLSEDQPEPIAELNALVRIAVKPIEVQEKKEESIADRVIFKTLSKYSYFESGSKWCKVLLPDLANLKDHPKEKLIVTFEKRSVMV